MLLEHNDNLSTLTGCPSSLNAANSGHSWPLSTTIPAAIAPVATPLKRLYSSLTLNLLCKSVCTIGALCLALLITLLFTLSPSPARAQNPPWRVDDGAVRQIFTTSASDNFVLCTLPVTAGGQPLTSVKAVANNAPRPSRLVWVDDQNLHVLVDCSGLGDNAVVALYGIPGSHAAKPQRDGALNPTPIRIVARRSVGQDSPASLEDYHVLTLRPGPRPEFFAANNFESLPDTIKQYAKGGNWTHPLSMLRLSTWLYIPETARYAFALSGDNAAWLQIDGTEIVGQTYSRSRPGQRESGAIKLEAGLHRLIIDTAVRYSYDLNVFWRAVDTNAADPQFITGANYVKGRLEQRHADFHPFITSQRSAPYRFQGNPAIFNLTALQDNTANWGDTNLQRQWWVNNKRISTDKELHLITVSSNDTPFEVTLEVTRPGTNTNTTRSTSLSLPAETVPAVEFRLSSSLTGVPAICYADDPITPVVEVRASSPDAITFRVEINTIAADGTTASTNNILTLKRSWGQLPITPGSANSLREINWQVSHSDITLNSGRWLFETAPFTALPDAVSGVSLLRNHHNLTLVARRASQGEANAFRKLRSGQRLLFLDGFVASHGTTDRDAAVSLDKSLANGPNNQKIAYQRVALSSLDNTSDPRGISRLAPLASLRTLLPIDAVLFAPDLSGARDGESPDLFERRLAAYAGTLTEAAKAQLILVAPPAFDILPGCGCEPGTTPCPHAAAGRLYAEIVYRVADAYGLTVADLYTPFALHKGPDPLFKAGILTPAGLNIATTIFNQVLYP